VLVEIDFNYLLLWGHYRLMIQMHENVEGKINDPALQIGNLGGLGLAYQFLGVISKSITYFERGIPAAKDAKNHQAEGAFFGNLGNSYADFGDARKAIEFHEKALVIFREVGDRKGESQSLENAGHAYLSIMEYQKAEISYQQSIQIADGISHPLPQNFARWGLAQVYLFRNDLVNARATIETALQYDVPINNHNATALHGIIALRQGERETAQEAFAKSIAQADEILAKTPDFYEALDAKGIALSGLVVSGKWEVDSERQKALDEAIETFRRAREIAPHAGVIKSVLRLFDELVKCDEEGMLKDVREVINTPLVE
jgi:tetratricopeptide (TPR) repeat protein